MFTSSDCSPAPDSNIATQLAFHADCSDMCRLSRENWNGANQKGFSERRFLHNCFAYEFRVLVQDVKDQCHSGQGSLHDASFISIITLSTSAKGNNHFGGETSGE